MIDQTPEQQAFTFQSYEQLRDGLPGGEGTIGTLWRAADRRIDIVKGQLTRIAEDASLTKEGKHEAAQRAIDMNASRIDEDLRKARAKVNHDAKAAYERSIPMPDGKTLANVWSKDASEITALGGEVAHVLEAVSGHSLKAELEKKGKQADNVQEAKGTDDVLRELYEEGMETGGIEGILRCRAVLRACDRLGIPADAVVDGFRDERHHSPRDEYYRLQHVMRTIPTNSGLKNPFSPDAKGGDIVYRSSGKLFLPRNRIVQRPSWK